MNNLYVTDGCGTEIENNCEYSNNLQLSDDHQGSFIQKKN